MRQRGFSFVEVLVSCGLMLLAILGGMALIATGLKRFNATLVDASLSQRNAQGLRRVSETLRNAMSISINSTGTTISYTLPRLGTTLDSDTGEQEYLVPLTSDGVTRSFTVANGVLTDTVTNRVLVRNISSVDLLEGSSQYNQAYMPFQLTTIGSTRAVSLNLITRETTGGEVRHARMKTTVMIRNLP